MTEFEDRLREDLGRLGDRYQGPFVPPPAVLAAVRRRRRVRGTAMVASAAVAATAAVVLAVTGLVGAARPGPAPATGAPPAPLPDDQFVGFLDSDGPSGGMREAGLWTFSTVTGQPVRRLGTALALIGLTGDRRWALVAHVPPPNSDCNRVVLMSLTTGEEAPAFPPSFTLVAAGLGGQAVGGQTLVAIAAPLLPENRQEGCRFGRSVLLTLDLSTGHLRSYPNPVPLLSSQVGEGVRAVSPDGHWIVLGRRDGDVRRFLLVGVDAGALRTTPLPPPPAGCTAVGFGFGPAPETLAIRTVCGRTMTITTYDPATLHQLGQTSIADPPGPAVTYFDTVWDRTGRRALLEAIHDNSTETRRIYVLEGGRLRPFVPTHAYGVTW